MLDEYCDINCVTERPVDPVVICLAVALGVCVLVIFAQAVICKWRNCEQRMGKSA